MILVIIAVLMTDTNTLTRTELVITVTMREDKIKLEQTHQVCYVVIVVTHLLQ